MYDLHTHSYFSDGKLSPKKLAENAKRVGLTGIALCDHDSYDGMEQMLHYGKKEKLRIIPAVEFGTTWEKDGHAVEIHILGYLMDAGNDRLQQTLSLLKSGRVQRVIQIVNILRDFGLDIDVDDVFQLKKKGFIGRGQIAEILVRKKYVQHAGEAFDRFIGTGKFAYVPKEILGYKEIIDLIHECGGVAICAHPKTMRNDAILDDLRIAGIDGLEIINSKHGLADVHRYNDYVLEHENLLATAGSDCHGHYKSNDQMYLGRYVCSVESVDALYERACFHQEKIEREPNE